jgi:hypothetical protein
VLTGAVLPEPCRRCLPVAFARSANSPLGRCFNLITDMVCQLDTTNDVVFGHHPGTHKPGKEAASQQGWF